ncbi:efflux RND transporter permease subunit [Shigella flexneri]
MLALAAENPELTRWRHNGLDDSPQLGIQIHQRKLRRWRCYYDINHTLQTAWASSYVNDFMDRGRVKKVTARQLRRIACCQMTSISGMSENRAAWRPSPRFRDLTLGNRLAALERYNGYSAG